MTQQPDVDVPVACTLDARAVQDRVADWRTALVGVSSVARAQPEVLVLTFPTTAPVARVAGLCAEEVQCCPFFTFTLEVRADAVTLTVRVPSEARDTLTGLVSLLPAALRDG